MSNFIWFYQNVTKIFTNKLYFSVFLWKYFFQLLLKCFVQKLKIPSNMICIYLDLCRLKAWNKWTYTWPRQYTKYYFQLVKYIKSRIYNKMQILNYGFFTRIRTEVADSDSWWRMIKSRFRIPNCDSDCHSEFKIFLSKSTLNL